LEEEDRWRVAVGERGRCGEVKIRWTRVWWMLRVFFSFYFYFFMFFLIKKKKIERAEPGHVSRLAGLQLRLCTLP
jgi:hypothetical protein